MITRDIVQGFIDGYVTAGGDPFALNDSVAQYLINHPVYPQTQDVVSVVISDISSYRVTNQDMLAPTPVKLIPISNPTSIQQAPLQ